MCPPASCWPAPPRPPSTSRPPPPALHLPPSTSRPPACRLQEEDFYVSRRRLTRPNVPAGFNPDTATRPAPGGANFGTPGPLELPTPGELRRAVEGGGLGGLKRLVSPVYLSTDAASGRVVVGLDRLPLPRSGPMLFVGNHQLFGELVGEGHVGEGGQRDDSGLSPGLVHLIPLTKPVYLVLCRLSSFLCTLISLLTPCLHLFLPSSPPALLSLSLPLPVLPIPPSPSSCSCLPPPQPPTCRS